MLLSLYLKAVQAGSTKGTGALLDIARTCDTPSPVPCLVRTLHHEGEAAALAVLHPKRAGAAPQAAEFVYECHTRRQGQEPHSIVSCVQS